MLPLIVLTVAFAAAGQPSAAAVRVITADQVTGCNFIDTFSGGQIGTRTNKALKAAHQLALSRAAEAGANAAVIKDVQTQKRAAAVVLDAYLCTI